MQRGAAEARAVVERAAFMLTECNMMSVSSAENNEISFLELFEGRYYYRLLLRDLVRKRSKCMFFVPFLKYIASVDPRCAPNLSINIDQRKLRKRWQTNIEKIGAAIPQSILKTKANIDYPTQRIDEDLYILPKIIQPIN